MANDVLKPIRLTKEVKDRLIEMEGNIRVLEAELDKAEKTGIDVTEMRKRFEEMKTLRKGLLKNYA